MPVQERISCRDAGDVPEQKSNLFQPTCEFALTPDWKDRPFFVCQEVCTINRRFTENSEIMMGWCSQM